MIIIFALILYLWASIYVFIWYWQFLRISKKLMDTTWELVFKLRPISDLIIKGDSMIRIIKVFSYMIPTIHTTLLPSGISL